MTAPIYITVNRAHGDEYTQSVDVWANSARIPQCDGDGYYAGNAVLMAASSGGIAWTPPVIAAAWHFLMIPIRHDVRGIGIGSA
jgi:hypothetical protein